MWKEIPGYVGLYAVSSHGDIKSLARQKQYPNCITNTKERIIKPSQNSKGYLQCVLYSNGSKKTFKVHKLVAIAFHLNPDNLPVVNHKDKNVKNNCVENLEWCSHSYNIVHGNNTTYFIENVHTGRVEKTNCLSNFCKEKSIAVSNLCKTFKGYRNHTGGWALIGKECHD